LSSLAEKAEALLKDIVELGPGFPIYVSFFDGARLSG
jgi:hypothetical protein